MIVEKEIEDAINLKNLSKKYYEDRHSQNKNNQRLWFYYC